MTDRVVRVGRARVSSFKGLAVSPVPVKRHRCSLNLNGRSQQSDVEGLFTWAGPHHHGLFEDNENLPAGVAVYTRAVWDKAGYLFVTDRGRPGSQRSTSVGLGSAFFRRDYLGFIKEGIVTQGKWYFSAARLAASGSTGPAGSATDEKPPGVEPFSRP